MDQNNLQNQQKINQNNPQPLRGVINPVQKVKPVLTQQQLIAAQQQAKNKVASQAVIPANNVNPLQRVQQPQVTPEEYKRLQESYNYTSKKNFVADSGAALLLAAAAVSVVIYIITRLL
jgi:hypothetical protein